MPPDLQENRRLVRHYFDLLNRNDLSGLEEILSPNVVFFGPRAPEGIYGREAFIEFIVALGRELPDLQFAEGEMVAEGSRVASVFTMRSTHSSEEARAKVITTEGMDLFHIVDGRIQQINAAEPGPRWGGVASRTLTSVEATPARTRRLIRRG